MDDPGLVCHSPKSLYCYCLGYVASNLPLIESLIGFPEMIGKEMFQAAVDLSEDSFCFKTSSGKKSLQLFFEAYGDSDILPSLSLSEDHIFLNDVIDDCWWIFENLVCLDVSSCGIGDGHDFLLVIDRMLRLQTLSLRNNQVTDEGVRRLTVKSRMSQTNCLVLKSLDVSSNSGITLKSVNFLRYFPSLALLDVSNTSMTFKDTVLLNGWEAFTEHEDKCDCVISNFLVRTAGWTADVLERWKAGCQLPKRTCMKSNSSADLPPTVGITGQTFYSRSTMRTVKSSSSSLSASSTRTSMKKHHSLILMSHTFCCPHTQPKKHLSSQSDADYNTHASSNIWETSINSVRLQTTGAGRCDKHENQCKLKTREVFTDCDLDESVLSFYKCSPPKKRLKKASVLQLLDDCS
ncbi:hypothetical protein BsWGS_19820 [Bradybaena similaris]